MHLVKSGLRRCYGCTDIKPLDQFHKRKREAGGRGYMCIGCSSDPFSKEGFRITIRTTARSRGLEWNLTYDEYVRLRKQGCSYCKYPIGGVAGSVGLDRIDNKVGYTLENVVPCCGPCNTLRWKGHFTSEEMMMFIGPAVKQVRDDRAKRGRKWLLGNTKNNPGLQASL